MTKENLSLLIFAASVFVFIAACIVSIVCDIKQARDTAKYTKDVNYPCLKAEA